MGVRKGVRQGNMLPALLFTLTLDAVIKEIERIGLINTKSTKFITYTDDVIIISITTEEEQGKTLIRLSKEAKKN